MANPQVTEFLKQAAELEAQTSTDEGLQKYTDQLELHFHRLDAMRTTLALWPCNMNLVPGANLRIMVGPEAYRYFFYSMAEHFWLIRHVCGFKHDQHLLDVGCGCGKTAFALLRVIKKPGSYTGFDIQPRLIDFMQRFFKSQNIDDHFRADCFPVSGNRMYTGAATGINPEEFTFPYEENHFDCAVLFSVFTHLRTLAMTNYVRNMARLLRPGGRVLVSCYLLDNSPEDDPSGAPWSPSDRRKDLKMAPDASERDHLKVLRPHNPEYLVAYRKQYLVDTFARFGCSLACDPLYGAWSGRSDFFGHQDYLVFRKDEAKKK